jgi:hypothetical protein
MINEPMDETSSASSTSSNTSAPASGRSAAPTEQRIPVTLAEREAIERVGHNLFQTRYILMINKKKIL